MADVPETMEATAVVEKEVEEPEAPKVAEVEENGGSAPVAAENGIKEKPEEVDSKTDEEEVEKKVDEDVEKETAETKNGSIDAPAEAVKRKVSPPEDDSENAPTAEDEAALPEKKAKLVETTDVETNGTLKTVA